MRLRLGRPLALAFIAALAAIPSAAASIGPPQSSPIAIARDQPILVCINPDAGSLSAFDVAGNVPAKLDEVKVGKQPSSVAINDSGTRAFVALAKDGKVAIVDLEDPEDADVDQKIKVGREPAAVLLSPNETRLYVANASTGDVSVIDLSLGEPEVIATIDLSAFGRAPRALAMTDDGDGSDADETLFAALFFAELRAGKSFLDEGQDDAKEGRVVAISAATNSVLGAPNPIRLAPLANAGFNSNGKLAPAPNQVPAVASVNPQAFSTQTGAFPNQLAALAIRPDSSIAYLVSTGASPNGPFRFNSNAQGLVSLFDVTTRLEITAGQTGPNVRRTAPLNLNQGINLANDLEPKLFFSNPLAIAWDPAGENAWIAAQQADAIVRLTVDANGIPTIGAPLAAGASAVVQVDLVGAAEEAGEIPGKAPRGIAIDAAGNRAFVYNFISRSITAIDISNPDAPAIVGTALSSKVPNPASTKGKILLGAELFFTGRGPGEVMSSEAWGSCATCHPDGHSDNVTWMFPTGPRQTIALEGMFDPDDDDDQRLLNWSAIQDENQDFELNTRNVFGGHGLILDDRAFFAAGGAAGAAPAEVATLEQYDQRNLKTSDTNLLAAGAGLPPLDPARRDFGLATLPDGRVLIVGGRSGPGQGELLTGPGTVLEFNPRTNTLKDRNVEGFTPRHSLGVATVITKKGPRVYAVGGFASTAPNALPVAVVEEYDPKTKEWRTVEPLLTPVAQFGIAVAGGINAAEPLQLLHVVGGNTGAEAAPATATATQVQRFRADPNGDGVWTGFNPGLINRFNHGAAAAVRGVTSRIFLFGGQSDADSFVITTEEYLAEAVTEVATLHTALAAPLARFGIATSTTTNQIYIAGGVDDGGTPQAGVLEYTIANNGPVAGPAGTPSGAFVERDSLAEARFGLQLSSPPGVVALLPIDSAGRDPRQDAIATFIATSVRALRAPVTKSDEAAERGRDLFGEEGLVNDDFSCATCHGGPKWTRSTVDYDPAPAPELGLGFGKERVIGAEVRQTKTQGPNVLIDVGTFTLGGGRTNEVRFDAADISRAIAPLGAAGFNIPSLVGVHATAPYFYSGLAETLEQVLDGSSDGSGGTRQHFVANAGDRADLVAFLRSIDSNTKTFD